MIRSVRIDEIDSSHMEQASGELKFHIQRQRKHLPNLDILLMVSSKIPKKFPLPQSLILSETLHRARLHNPDSNYKSCHM